MPGKMNGRVVSLFAVCAAGFVLVGCDGAKKEVALLKEENSQLTMQLDETRNALDGEMQERRRLEQELSNLKLLGGNVLPDDETRCPTWAPM